MPNTTSPYGSNLPLLKVLASPFLSLQQALTACDDCWTWTTVSGEIYEHVELLRLTPADVTFRHVFVVSTIARADLTRDIQQSLIDHSELPEPDFASDIDLEAPDSYRATAQRAARFSEVA